MNYKEAGVDIKKGDAFVERIKRKVLSTYNENVVQGIGGFNCLYDIAPDKYLVAGSDGVGTKIKLAIELGIHNSIGIDLVAMCVNDILCSGATPLFFMDYMASSSLDLEVSSAVIDGIVEGCKLSEMPLIGGETAEMPGMYQVGDYDLAGFCVGEVKKDEVIDGNRVSHGDTLVAISSAGFHSNGFSLLRNLIVDESEELKRKLLTPTRIYYKLIKEFKGIDISGIAHITGGGIENIKRINSSFEYQLTNIPDISSTEFKKNVCDSFDYIAKKSLLSEEELYRTFNMGMGLVISTRRPDLVVEISKSMGYEAWSVGRVQ